MGIAVMHYSRHRLTASVAYVSMLTYTSTNGQWARPACPSVSSLKTKSCQFSLVQFSYVFLCAPQRNDYLFLSLRFGRFVDCVICALCIG